MQKLELRMDPLLRGGKLGAPQEFSTEKFKRPPQHFPKREIRREGRLRGLRYATTLRFEEATD